MKTLLHVLVLSAALCLTQLFLPWWTLAIVVVVFCLITKESKISAILVSFASTFLVWALTAVYQSSISNGVLTSKIGVLFGGISDVGLILVTGLFAGLLALLAALTATATRDFLR